jgi:hypothetical protein
LIAVALQQRSKTDIQLVPSLDAAPAALRCKNGVAARLRRCCRLTRAADLLGVNRNTLPKKI